MAGRSTFDGDPSLPTLAIDGDAFSTLEGFFDEVSSGLIPGADWGRSLDAFNDVLRGGFGTPEDGFNLLWRNSERSRRSLGFPETIRQLRHRITAYHPANALHVKRELEAAERGEGDTVFEWLIEIILDHGPGGLEADDNVHLILD